MPVLKVYKNGVWEDVGIKLSIDDTLTLSGVAADAKAVGDAIEQVRSEIPSVTTDDNGAFLRVVDGVWATATVPNAEEASF